MFAVFYYLLIVLSLCPSAKTRDDRPEFEARVKRGGSLLQKLIPVLVMPFVFQITMLPAMILSLKFMLLQSMVLGKFAILFGALSLLRHLGGASGGFYSHNVHAPDSVKREDRQQKPAFLENVEDLRYSKSRLEKIRERLEVIKVPEFTYLD